MRHPIWGFFWKLITGNTHKKTFSFGDPFAISLKPHLDKHVFREGVEVVASVFLWVALSSAAGACYHPVVVKALKKQRHTLIIAHADVCPAYPAQGKKRDTLSLNYLYLPVNSPFLHLLLS